MAIEPEKWYEQIAAIREARLVAVIDAPEERFPEVLPEVTLEEPEELRVRVSPWTCPPATPTPRFPAGKDSLSEKELWRRARIRKARQLFSFARYRARLAGLPFDLTREWFELNYTGFCQLTGIRFQNIKRSRNPLCGSLDRIDPAQGYVMGNCRFILWGLNALKGVGSDALMAEIASAFLSRR